MLARLLALLKRAWRVMASLLGETSGPTLALTGILGLAAVLYAIYQLRGPAPKPDEQGGQQQQQQQQQLDSGPNKPSTSAAAGPGHSAAPSSPSAAVSRRLAGIKRVTMSVPGVLLQESSPGDLDESASVRTDAVELARDIVRCCSQGVYLMCHVDDDIGEAVVRGALEHAGLLGTGAGQVPPHRLLFCGTLLGKVSMVRQLEPDLHIDGHPQTVSDLQRFVNQLLLVQAPDAAQNLAGNSAAAATAANVQHAASLAAAMEPVRAVEGLSNKDIENVMMMFISDLTQSLTPVKRRALLSLGGGEGVSFGDFMSNLFGGSWRDHVPEGWTLPSFDWSDLGEFEYSNNMGEFLMSHDLPELVTVTSPQDLHDTLETIESSFCKAEEFKPAAKVPAACQGPKVSIALVPKICTLQGATKQVVCDPAKLVLTKTPGSCTHKHLSASKWTGKECKISGTAGLASNKTVGGGIKEIPLTSFFHSDSAATEFAAAPAPAPITA